MRLTRRAHALAVAAIVLAPTLATAVASPTAACAASTAPHAALVVDTGSAVHTYCVALDAPTVSGLHVIELASTQGSLSYAFGFGGQAVCRLADTGPTGGDCFASYPRFWGYWHGDGRGGWSWSSTGPGSSAVGGGDVDGWVWGTGDSGATHARPPSVMADEVCAPPPARSDPSPTSSGTAPAPSSHTHAPAVAITSTPRAPAASASSSRATSPRPTPSRDGLVRAATVPDPSGRDGPPPGLFAALGIGLALGAAGWWRVRSSRRAGG